MTGSRTLSVFILFFVLGQSAIGQTGTKEGFWIVYQNKEQFRLEEARRIPVGATASIRGYPLDKEIPHVFIRRPDSGTLQKLEVLAEPQNDSWIAPLPKLEPKVKTEVIVKRFRSLNHHDKKQIRGLIVRMLFTIYEGSSAGKIRSDTVAIRFAEIVENYLRDHLPPDKTFASYAIVTNAAVAGEDLREELISRFGTYFMSDLGKINVLADYLDAIGELHKEVIKHLGSATLPPDHLNEIRSFWKPLPSALFAPAAIERISALNHALTDSILVLPIESSVAAAHKAFINNMFESSTIVETRKKRLLGSVDNLGKDLEELFPDLFLELRRVEARTFSAETITLPFGMGDLERYGTADFVTGYIPGLGQPRGFLTFSFFPGGPEPRTPDGASGRYALALGYSVVGGSKDDTPLFLGGLAIRSDRLISYTIGVVSNVEEKGPWYFFVGIAGDLTGIPFLKDFFVAEP